MALLAGRPLYSNSRTVPTLTERTLATLVAISSSPSSFVRLHELAYQRRVRGPRRSVLEIEREIVLAPEDQKLP